MRDYYGQDQNYSEVRYVKVERELELRQVNVELGPSFSEYAEKGVFVIGQMYSRVKTQFLWVSYGKKKKSEIQRYRWSGGS